MSISRWMHKKVVVHIHNGILLLLLSHFSHVWLCVTPYTAAHQAPLSLGFSRQEYWNVLPLPSPMHACQVASIMPDSVWPHGQQPTRLHCPQDSPGKNTGVSYHFPLHNGILLSYRKEHIWVHSNEVGETGANYAEWSKLESKTPVQYINAYIWNLERQ